MYYCIIIFIYYYSTQKIIFIIRNTEEKSSQDKPNILYNLQLRKKHLHATIMQIGVDTMSIKPEFYYFHYYY